MNRNIPLLPLTPDSERKIPGFAVCDVEAKNWIEFLMIGLLYKLYDNDGKLVRQEYQKFTDLKSFCDACFSPNQPHNTIFAHFGGRYDFSFIISEFFKHRDNYRIHDMLPRGSGLLCMSVSKLVKVKQLKKDMVSFQKFEDGSHLVAERTIVFRDSSAMLPFGLGSLTENFNVKHKKMEIDHESVTELTPEMEEYAEQDHWGLYEVIESYFNWPIIRSAGPAFTVASQALKVWRTFINDPVPSITGKKDEFVRRSYFGGRTEIFKPFFQKADDRLLKSYDVNSLYPSIMRDNDMPTKFDCETNRYYENRMGFYDIEIEVPDMYVPPLGAKFESIDDRLIFPTGRFRGTFSSIEINYALSLGCKIRKVHIGLLFKNGGKIFKDYVETLYDIRKKAEKNSVDSVLAKLLLNSCYGRAGLNTDREQLVFDNGEAGLDPIMEIQDSSDRSQIVRLAKKQIVLDTSWTNVAIAAWVTSCARIHMHKLIQQAPEDMYYMDTDSLKTTHTYDRNDADLGKLKLEYSSTRAAFLLPKTYLEDTTSPIFKLFDANGKEVKGEKTGKKIVMKGFDKRKIAHFTFEDFAAALEGDLKRLSTTNPKKFATLRTAVKKGDFLRLIDESPREIRSRYNKRRVIKRDYAQVWDTEPLHVKNGEIVNLE